MVEELEESLMTRSLHLRAAAHHVFMFIEAMADAAVIGNTQDQAQACSPGGFGFAKWLNREASGA